MPREQYVRPPLVPREAPAAWRSVWPFRVVVLLLLVVLTVLLAYAYSALNDSGEQDPGVGASAPLQVDLDSPA
ncbi:MAG: hypothetical protein JWN17_527 [Frankiales bacterium]|nr:hypothetical protein [Frankiales bacterium]